MNWGLLTAVFLPKMLTYHCFTAVDWGKKTENLFKRIYIWTACTSTEPISLFGDLHVCTAKQCSLQEWPIDTFLKVYFNILHRFITIIFFLNRGFSSQYKSSYTKKYLSNVRP